MEIPTNLQDLQNDLKTKKYSAVELVDALLKRIAVFDPKIKAFITITSEEAYKDAKSVDKILQEKGEGVFNEYPLLGLPVGYKDIFLTKGIRTTAASKVLENYIPQYSSTVVERLKKAGVIGMGKLNLDAWAHGSSGENSDFAVTANPWNYDFVPGGSSSGSGASVAADFVMAATATDTCGSIRLPANYCGVVGLKPTYGSVSRYGVIAMASSLDSIGHITKTVLDSKRIYQVTSGVDNADATLKEGGNINLKDKYVIGIPKEFFGEGLEPVIEKNLEEIITFYKSRGVEFKEISLPHTKYAIAAYYIIQPAEVSSNLGRYDGVRYGNGRDTFGDEAKRRIMLGTYVLSAGYYDAYYLQAMKVRTIIRTEVNKAFEEVDAIIAPVAPTPPFKIGDKVDDPLKMYLTDIYAATANLSGIPSLAIPSGFTSNRLPLGFQLMGQRFSENILFDLGMSYQKETTHHLQKPKLTE